MIDLYSYKQSNDKDNIILNFTGPLSHELIVSLGEMIRQEVSEDCDGSPQIALKVFAIFVEQAENVIHYSTQKSSENSMYGYGIITIGKRDGNFYISCGNLIPGDKVEVIEASLKKISDMNKDEIKAYYREKRRAEKTGDSKGAGIGFIEMAKKASQPIQYKFNEINHSSAFFSIEITI
ncbi:MAG: hypothetical protein HQL46_10675 [Gammaproteobacteria bacterium]|nr:hypothetical protein [Gammaproteobacteria bacterium]